MITILFRTDEPELPNNLCLDTASAVYISPDRKVIVETEGGIDYISSREMGTTRFEAFLQAGFNEGRLDLSLDEFGVFSIYEPIEDIDPDDEEEDI